MCSRAWCSTGSTGCQETLSVGYCRWTNGSARGGTMDRPILDNTYGNNEILTADDGLRKKLFLRTLSIDPNSNHTFQQFLGSTLLANSHLPERILSITTSRIVNISGLPTILLFSQPVEHHISIRASIVMIHSTARIYGDYIIVISRQVIHSS